MHAKRQTIDITPQARLVVCEKRKKKRKKGDGYISKQNEAFCTPNSLSKCESLALTQKDAQNSVKQSIQQANLELTPKHTR